MKSNFIRKVLKTPVSEEQISIDDAKAHLRVENSEDDILIGGYIASARDEADGVCRRRFGSQEWTLYFDGFNNITLFDCGVVDSVSVSVRTSDGTWALVSDNDFELIQTLPSKIRFRDSFSIPEPIDYTEIVSVDVLCGEDAPPSVKSWMLLRIGTLYENREADSERRVEPQQFVSNLLDKHKILDYS